LTQRPYIRDSACGAVLLQCKDGKNPNIAEREVLDRGEICGMWHYADLTARNSNSAGEYLIYADAFDPLIRDGWSVMPAPGMPEEANVEGLENSNAPPRRAGLRSGRRFSG
jgi:hypothetical protein